MKSIELLMYLGICGVLFHVSTMFEYVYMFVNTHLLRCRMLFISSGIITHLRRELSHTWAISSIPSRGA